VSSPALRPAQAFAVYTGARVAAFVVCLGLLYLVGFRRYALVLGALLLSAVASLLLLRHQRAVVSTAIASRPRRPRRQAVTRPMPGRDPDDPHADDPYAEDPYADDPHADDPYAEDDLAGEDPYADDDRDADRRASADSRAPDGR
jgi:hypothetical protein